MTAATRIKNGELTDKELRALRAVEARQPVTPKALQTDLPDGQPLFDLGEAGLIEMRTITTASPRTHFMRFAWETDSTQMLIRLTDAGVERLFFDRRRTV